MTVGRYAALKLSRLGALSVLSATGVQAAVLQDGPA